VPTLDPNSSYIRNAWKEAVLPLAEKLKVPMNLPPMQPRSRRAHEAAHWAGSTGAFAAYNAALFRAFFERGEDIGDTGVLIRLAADLGLDGERLGMALERREFEKGVLADEEDAARFGVRAVPCFVADGTVMLSGVQPAERLKEMIGRVRKGLVGKGDFVF